MKRLLSFLLAVIFLMGFAASGTSCTALLLTALISNYSAQENHDISGKVEHSENIWFDPMPDTGVTRTENGKNENEEPSVSYPDENGNGIPDYEEDDNKNGIPDFEEDKNQNGIPDFKDPEIDENMNGIPDINEIPGEDPNQGAVTRPENGLLSGEEFVLDGDLSDFKKYSESALMIQGVQDNVYSDSLNKSVYFYGVMTEKGLFVACEAYHNELVYGDPDEYFTSSSFIMLFSESQQFFCVSATGDNRFGINGTGIEAYMKTEESGGSTNYRTVAEMFVSAYDLEFYEIYPKKTESVEICLAWSTPGDIAVYEYNSEPELFASDVWEIPYISLTRYGIYSETWGH